MVDTVRTKTALLTSLFQDGQPAAAITPQDVRDMIVSMAPPMMGVYFSTPASTNVTGAGTYLKAAGTTTVTNSMGDLDDNGGTSNRIRYTGAAAKHFHVVCQASVSLSGGTNQKLGIQVYHYDDSAASGSLLAHSEAQTTVAATAVEQITTHADVILDTNDYIELWITNHTSAANDPQVDLGYLFAMGVIM